MWGELSGVCSVIQRAKIIFLVLCFKTVLHSLEFNDFLKSLKLLQKLLKIINLRIFDNVGMWSAPIACRIFFLGHELLSKVNYRVA